MNLQHVIRKVMVLLAMPVAAFAVWTPPIIVSPESIDSTLEPSVTLDKHSNATTAYTALAHSPLFSSFLPNNEAEWDSPLVVDFRIPFFPLVSAGKHGTVTAVSTNALFNPTFLTAHKKKIDSLVWGPPVLLGLPPAVVFTSYAVDFDGDVIAGYTSLDGPNNTKYLAVLPSKCCEWATYQVSSEPFRGFPTLDVAVAAVNDRGFGLWSVDAPQPQIQWVRFNFRCGAWGVLSRLDLPAGLASPLHVNTISVAMDSKGDVVALFSIGGNRSSLYASTLSACTNQWSPFQLLSSSLSGTFKVVSDRNGDAVAIWVDRVGSTSALRSSNLPKNGGWTSPVTLTDPSEEHVFIFPDLVINACGDAIAIWEDDVITPDGHEQRIDVVRQPAGEDWDLPATTLSHSGTLPRVAINNDGNAVAVWNVPGVNKLFSSTEFGPFPVEERKK